MLIRSPELVGRAGELRELSRAFDDALAGRGRAVFLAGESGIGKSRLAREAAARAAGRGARVLRGQGSTVGPVVPFRPLAEALLSLTRDAEPVDVGELGPYLPALGVLVPDWRCAAADEPAPPLLVVAEAVLRLLAVVGRAGGCVLVLDDLHDADAETLFVLEYLLGNLESARVLLIGTIRDDASAARDIARSAARRGACTLRTLPRLGGEAVHELVAACLGTDRARVPAETAAHLGRLSAGIPFLLEELLHELVHDRVLTERPAGWRLADTPTGAVPAALAGSIATRTARLGPEGAALLAVAAVLGPRFSAPVVQRAAGADDRTMAAFLDAAADARLVEPDPAAVGWYTFGHPLTAEAVLTQLGPTRRAELARLAADAVELLHPGLPGDWCALAAELRQLAGDRAAAGRLFADAGRRALETAAAGAAVSLLTRADAVLTESPDLPLRGAVLESLVHALGETGQADRAFALAARFSEVGLFDRAAVLHARLAWAALLAGRTADGLAQVTAARTRRGPDRQRAAIDAVHALLLLELPGRAAEAGQLATAALAQAERHDDPVATCQALLALGVLTRERDPDAARGHLDRARRLTESRRMPLWRTHVLLRLGEHVALTDGDTGGLVLARQHAERGGSVAAARAADVAITLYGPVLGGDFGAAEHRLSTLAHGDVVRAVCAAHRADRPRMAEAIAAVRAAGGDHHPDLALCLGLAQAFCALLEEDRDRARRDLKLARAHEPGGSPLSGQHGLALLLDVLAGDAEPDAAAAPAARLRWNRQFTALAQAVWHGRQGDTAAAEAAAKEAREAAYPYRMAAHLGARLVAEAALADGWGDPVPWLRAAEEYFHDAAIPAVAAACRTLLRRAGEPVRQRRPGLHHLPRELREAGVTVREYDVFRLLAHRLGNTDIARRLLISPKTVEKHVSSLMTKTKLPDRVTLFDYAATLSS
ncbi:helix-turn-helix transcriptional regulator [Amycolatopsis australiensis]|uniref:Regulatory protein, luxR family n=1 Tax=Amycolatopsis australiensis TaxID=546364 RepID=A0A1K1SMP7_9PSEU|nr:LuxR family transcriptional regulator [Amycolatopsis australiensis]SFW85484.1 regulatory protein, luxR family [Amycolatopsis australiensis]